MNAACRLLLSMLMLACAWQAHGAETKTLRYAFEVAETGFDPAQISDLYSRNITANLFDAPLRFAYLEAPGTIEPNTASALPEISSDFKTFTFHLKPGIYFTDDPAFNGKRRELVAEDYVFSFKRLYDPRWKSPVLGQYLPLHPLGLDALRAEAEKSGKFDYDKQVEGIRALDRYTFRITLSEPSPRFAENWADPSTMGALAREVVERYGDAIPEHPVGTGAFKLKTWVRSSRMVFERNADYRNDIVAPTLTDGSAAIATVAKSFSGKRLPLLDQVEISVIEESQPRWLSFLNADQDYLYLMPLDLASIAIPHNKLAPNLARKHLVLDRVPFIDVTLVEFNMESPVVGGYTPEKVALRRAILLALNTDDIIRSSYKNQAFPAQSVIMPMTYGYDPTLSTELGKPDLARARAILDAYGYTDKHGSGWRDNPDGSPLVLEDTTQPDQRSRIQDEIWKKSMNALGLRLNFRVAKWPENLKSARTGQFMIWGVGQSAAAPDSTPALRLAYGPASGSDNLARFHLAAYDQAFEAQDRMPDGPERLDKIRDMERLLTAYAPMGYVAHRYAIDMSYPWVKGLQHWPFARDWWKYVDIDTAERDKALNP